MPSIKKFKIKNFKGAEQVEIKLKGKIDYPVITLIGLNESGKTTILEAISHFVTDDKAVASIFKGAHTKDSLTSLIPIHRRAAFTGNVTISAEIEITETDKQEIKSIASQLKWKLNIDSLPNSINASRVYRFENGKLEGQAKSFWDGLNLMVYSSSVHAEKNKKFENYKRPEDGITKDIWLKCILHLKKSLPSISYFPTFLVDMPSKIYLQEHKNEQPVNKYYRHVIQDILDSLDDTDKLTLEDHLCKRIRDFRKKDLSDNWPSKLLSSSEKGLIDPLFEKIGFAITHKVLENWRKVFQKTLPLKTVTLGWGIDTEKNNLPYTSLSIADGESRYAIDERSLGFRWFFSFLLFTSFKKGKNNSTIFLFDEPAANLHAKAQTELLKSFSKIIDEGSKIIYSTHSHHMINPQWLSGAYIIENTAIDYDSEDVVGLDIKPTDIKATTYREFAGRYPNRQSYFQPIIEKLDYIVPELIGKPPFLILEGISDYFAFTLAKHENLDFKNISLMPCSGATTMGPLISLLLGRGENFFILLDDDNEGRKAAKGYKSKWILSERQVATIGEILPEHKGKQLEGLFTQQTIQHVKNHFEIKEEPNKKQIGLCLAEAAAQSNNSEILDNETILNLRAVMYEVQQFLVPKKT